MLTLTILDLLYLVLTFFIAVIGTLLTIVLMRALKVLWVVVELVDYYNKLKQILWYYSHIPGAVKDSVMSILKKDDK